MKVIVRILLLLKHKRGFNYMNIINKMFLLFFFTLVMCGQGFTEESINSEYRISPNDLVQIDVYNEPDLSRQFRIASDGSISFPLIGAVSTSGLTAKELEVRINGLLEADYLIKPQVNVFVKEFAKYSILGNVKLPGVYQLKSGLKLLDAIALAGGFTDKANVEDVKVIREVNGLKENISINVKEISKEGAKEEDLIISPRDLIMVGGLIEGTASSEYIIVLGQVRRPGRHPYSSGMTAAEAISLAGGFTDSAAGNSTKVIREDEYGKKTFLVPVGSVLSGRTERDIELKAGDKVVVPESFF